MKTFSSILWKKFGLIYSLLLAFFIFISAFSQVHAASLTNWNAGRIIDDGIFTYYNSMSVSMIQAFLNSKVPVCDTSGAQPSEYGGGTRAQWGQANYGQSTFICLKDYIENGKTSAQIIYNISQQYKINPQVLIVLLQKEQGLVTDTWPLGVQYRTAAGYGCPDTAACDSQYYGLTNQLDWAAKMYRAIINNSSTWYTPYKLGNGFVKYSPDSSCGGSTVDIQNRATQALYNYTPYQPNKAALDAGYGNAACGSYGNRNFYLYFTDWFGSTQSYNTNISLSRELSLTSTSGNGMVYQGDTVTATFRVSNTASYDTDAGGLGVCARLNGQNYDIGFKDHNIIPANGATDFTYSRKINSPGTLDVFLCSYNERMGGWAASGYYPYDTTGNMLRMVTKTVPVNPIITVGVALSPTNPVVGQPVTATVTLSNASPANTSVGTLVFGARDAAGNNVDFPSDVDVVVPGNGTLTYTKTRTFNAPGKYMYFLANLKDGVWSSSYPVSNSGVVRSGSFTVGDNPLVSTSLSLNPQNPAIGQLATISFTVTNNSPTEINVGSLAAAVRDPFGNNVDFIPDNDVIVPANGTYKYSKTKAFVSVGSYKAFIANYRGGRWDMGYPKSSSNSITRSIDFSVKDNPLLLTGLSFSPSQVVVGQPVTVQFSIRNDSSTDTTVGSMVVAARDPYGNNVDFPMDSDVVIAADSTYTYSKTKTFDSTGGYKLFIANYKNTSWSTSYPKSTNTSLVRQSSFIITDNPFVTAGLSFSPSTLTRGQDVSVSVTIRNDSSAPVSVGRLVVAARDPFGNNVDFPSDPELVLPASSSITYKKTRQFSVAGQYSFFIADYKNGLWSRDYPKSIDTSINRSITKIIN